MPHSAKFDSLDERISSDLTLRELLSFLRRMNHMPRHGGGRTVHTSFFQEIRDVKGGSMFGEHWLAYPTRFPNPAVDPRVQPVLVEKHYNSFSSLDSAVTCGPRDSRTKVIVSFQCSNRSFDHSKGGSLYDVGLGEERFRFRDTWHDDDVASIEVSGPTVDFAKALVGLIAHFRKLEQRISHPEDWEKSGLKAAVQCRCGHLSITTATKLCSGRPIDEIFSVRDRLQCTACGTKGAAEILPWFAPDQSVNWISINNYFGMSHGFRFNTRAQAKEYQASLSRAGQSFKGYKAASGSEEGTKEDWSDGATSDLYKTMDGDGVNSVYLGDGMSIAPNGSLSDD